MASENLKLLWVTSGYYFGYPVCCTEHFTKYADDASVWPKYMLQLQSTRHWSVMASHGFIPCPDCASSYSKATMCSIINQNRHTDLPSFPCDKLLMKDLKPMFKYTGKGRRRYYESL